MNNSRRFTAAQKTPAPKTPHGAKRVLPTPPASAAPLFRVADDSDLSMHHNTESANPRPTAQGQAQSGIAPKLPLNRLYKQRNPQLNDSRPDNTVVPSPARASKGRAQAQDLSGGDNARPQHVFGQPNGLLPSLSRHSSPPFPSLIVNSPQRRQAPNTRFSSPVSPVENEAASHNAGKDVLGAPHTSMDDSGPHTSASTIFNQARVATAGPADDEPLYQRAVQTHTAIRQEIVRGQSVVTEFQDDYDVDVVHGSPSPTAFSKRRAAEEHGTHVSAKRLRSNLHQVPGFGENTYPSQEQEQEQEQPAPSPARRQVMPSGVYSTGLETYIGAHQDEWIAAQKRWENCTMEEWQSGSSELTAELEKVMEMVKNFMIKRMEVYANINKDVDTHKARLDARDALLAKEKERLVKQAGGLAV